MGLLRLLSPGIRLQKANVIHSTPTSCLSRLVPLLKVAVQLSTATILTAQVLLIMSTTPTAVIASALEEMSSRASNSLLAVHNKAHGILECSLAFIICLEGYNCDSKLVKVKKEEYISL